MMHALLLHHDDVVLEMALLRTNTTHKHTKKTCFYERYMNCKRRHVVFKIGGTQLQSCVKKLKRKAREKERNMKEYIKK